MTIRLPRVSDHWGFRLMGLEVSSLSPHSSQADLIVLAPQSLAKQTPEVTGNEDEGKECAPEASVLS